MCICMYKGLYMIDIEMVGIVEGVGVTLVYSAAFGFHSTKVKNIL